MKSINSYSSISKRNKQAFFELIEDTISCVNTIFQTVFKTFFEDMDKIMNALELPYSNAETKGYE